MEKIYIFYKTQIKCTKKGELACYFGVNVKDLIGKIVLQVFVFTVEVLKDTVYKLFKQQLQLNLRNYSYFVLL